MKQCFEVANPCKQWDQEVITNILMACVVLHNMTIEDEHNLNLEPSFDVKENTTLKKRISFENYFKGTTQIEIHDFHYNFLK